MYVQVPPEFWDELEPAGFDEVELGSRSGDQWTSVAHAVLSVGTEGLSVTANLVGVYLAREQIGEFVQRAAAWFGFKARNTETDTSSLVLTITAASAQVIRIEITSADGPDGTSVLDTAALTGAILSAIETTTDAAD